MTEEARKLADDLEWIAAPSIKGEQETLYKAATALRSQPGSPASRPQCDGLMTCAAAKFDGVTCADDTCDWDTGVRKPPLTPSHGATREALEKVLIEAMGWHPSENGPSYGTARKELSAKIAAALTPPSEGSGFKPSRTRTPNAANH